MVSTAMKEKPTSDERYVSDESILKIAKEIAVKFIEVGRITPASFDKDFPRIYSAIEATVRKNQS